MSLARASVIQLDAMRRFTQEIHEMLKRNGWHEGREYDYSKDIEVLQAEGYPVFDEVMHVLREFGGLKLVVKDRGDAKIKDVFHFNAAAGAESVYVEQLNIYSKMINKRLSAIGECFSYHAILMVSDDGSIYAAYGDILWKLGDSIEEAIEVLYLRKEIEEIPYNYDYRDHYEAYFGDEEGYVWKKE